jgi:hypothetical protein
MREICTSGSVRGEGGNILTYSAVLLPQRREMGSESPPIAHPIEIAEEGQPARRVGVGEPGQEEPPEQAREHPHRQQEAGSARNPACPVERDPAARHDHVNVRMVGHCRAPAVEYRGGTDAGTQMPGIGGYGEQRLGGCAEQQIVDHRLVLIGDRGDLGRQREDKVEVADRQQVGFARGKPVPCRRALTFWAMAVATGVVGNPAVAALLTALDMAAERGRAALLDRRHHLELIEAHVPGIGLAPSGAMAMEDVCDLQPRAAHRRRLASGSRSLLGQRREPVERAGHAVDRSLGDTRVKSGGVELGVPEQDLDDPDVGVLFEQMGGKAVP